MTENTPPASVITCAEDNQQQFRAAFRQQLGAEGQAFAKALYDAGLIAGLRGARLGPSGGFQRPGEVAVRPTLSDAAETRLADLWWKRTREARR